MEARNVNFVSQYDEYMNLPEGTRAELIDGVIYNLDSATIPHQSAAGGIFGQLFTYLIGKRCKVLYEIDVQLDEDDVHTILKPDMVVVCDPKKTADRRRIIGAPDMIVEVRSPSTQRHDRVFKYNRYLDAGVREYWIVVPDDQYVEVYTLVNGQYVSTSYEKDAKIKVSILDDCIIDLAVVFPAESGAAPAQ
ncbi:hypothetical protein FACS1894184_20950 [Clostridia bacterium]|nr:hypothetical protein FACS1894184_20950 [Clostridia bacterium]